MSGSGDMPMEWKMISPRCGTSVEESVRPKIDFHAEASRVRSCQLHRHAPDRGRHSRAPGSATGLRAGA
jgi:hypothetical protein